ncbi:hypothetical protein H0H92_008757 [Tricholoma furcatifolium]|nr:hypothetical protein H0H92_008757 [Tricholoma furcatifolium]
MVHITPLYIGGVPKLSSSTFDVINPGSGLVVGQSVNASREDCQAAVDNAANAFKTWERSPIAQRRAVFLKASELTATEKYKTLIMESIELETGASDAWSTFNWSAASHILSNAVGFFGDLHGQIVPSGLPGAKLEVHRRAMGVILSIAPWNAPFILSLRAVLLPILCGNTVVLKSSEHSPRSQAVVVELFQEAGLPSGVLNYVSASREDAPARTAELIAHPAVRKITFTGSDRVGRIIATEAAKYLKPCILELGGKSPVIVLNDADVSAAAPAIVKGAFSHNGQVCMSTERVIVQSGVAPRLLEAVKSLTKNLDGTMGPLFTDVHATNVVGMLKEAVDGGEAELLYGDLTRKQAVVQPHLVKFASKGSETGKGVRAWEKESFGPVIVFATVETVDEAVELANASEYTLAAAVWTNDIYKAQEVANRVRSGFTNINGPTLHSEPLVALRGLGGASGYGRFDVDAFTDLRVIAVHPPAA